MKVGDKQYRSIWLSGDQGPVHIIDQTRLPYEFVIVDLETVEDAEYAISQMQVRGAPLIGATGAFGMGLAAKSDPSAANLSRAYDLLLSSRPTAINLRWALDRVAGRILEVAESARSELAFTIASDLCREDIDICSSIGDHGLNLIRSIYDHKEVGSPVNILTHCNAGWLATVDWGTALAPIYKADAAGVPVHVWVDETRPRNQGAYLTTWELQMQGIDHTLIVDNAGGHLMQRGLVDLCMVGTDRTTRRGDVCNKIGTYLKALAAKDNDVPFYVAAPSPSIDWSISDGGSEIPIEQRSRAEVATISGLTDAELAAKVRIVGEQTKIRNDAFDVTPAGYITGLITERGVCQASESALSRLFPELAQT